MSTVLVLGLVFVFAMAGALVSLAFLEVAFQGPFQPIAASPGTRRAIVPRQGYSTVDAKCPSTGERQIHVTPLEIQAVADHLRRSLPVIALERVRQTASANARRARGVSAMEYEAAHIPCPLLGDHDSCLADAARPSQCNQWCLHSGEEGDRCLMHGTEACDVAVQSVSADTYELNGALATALSSPR